MALITQRLALTSVIRRKQRNIAVILGIALGVTLVAGIQVSIDSSKVGWDYMFTLPLGEVDEAITPLPYPAFNSTLAEDMMHTIDELDCVQSVTARLVMTATLQTEEGNIEPSMAFNGVLANETGFGSYFVEDDTEPVDLNELALDEVVVGSWLADLLEVEAGDNVYVTSSFAGRSLTGEQFRVKAVLSEEEEDSKNMENLGQFFATSVENMWTLLGMTDGYSEILINFDDDIDTIDKLEDAAGEVEAAVLAAHPFLTDQVLFDELRSTTLTNTVTLSDSLAQIEWIFGSLIIFAALLVILNIQGMSFEEREKNTAVLRAVGASRTQVVKFFLGESLGLGVIGSALGAFGGIAYARFLLYAFGLAFGFDGNQIPTVITGTAMSTAIISGLTISFLTAVLPALKASKVDVVKVLRGLKEHSVQKIGKKNLWIGLILTFLGVFWLATLDPSPLFDGKDAFLTVTSTEACYLPIAFLLAGPGLILATKVSRFVGMNFVALGLIGWAVTNIFVIFDWIDGQGDSGGMIYVTYLMFSLVIGSIILVGSNLSRIASAMELAAHKLKIFGKNTQAVVMISLRHMSSTKVRATLTFALFACVLTLNIFIATWSYSERYGLESTFEKLSGGSEVLVYSQTPLNGSIDFKGQLEQSALFGDDIVEVMGVLTSPSFGFRENNTLHSLPVHHTAIEQSDFFTDTGDWKFELDLFDDKCAACEQGDFEDEDVNAEDEDVWRALVTDARLNATHPYPLIVSSPMYDTHNPANPVRILDGGDVVWMTARNGSLVPFGIAALCCPNPMETYLMFAGSQMGFAGGGGVWFVNEKYTSEIAAFQGMEDTENLFLVDTEFTFKSDEAVDLASDIETFANGQTGSFVTNYGFHGIVACEIYSLFENLLEGQYRFFQFMQLFTTIGFAVGVLGLLVVSVRSVSERRREIGMMRAIGLSQRSVLLTVVIELLLITVIGFILGIINGGLMGYALVHVSTGGETEFLIPYGLIGLYALLSAFAATIAAAVPGYLAARIPPSQALRYIG